MSIKKFILKINLQKHLTSQIQIGYVQGEQFFLLSLEIKRRIQLLEEYS